MNTNAIALSGMNAATLRLGTAANNIANGQTSGYRRQSTTQQTAPGGGVSATVETAALPGESMAEDAVSQLAASYDFKFNLNVLQTQDRMLGTLLDERV